MYTVYLYYWVSVHKVVYFSTVSDGAVSNFVILFLIGPQLRQVHSCQ